MLYHWGDSQQRSFETIKKNLTTIPTLAHYDPTRETRISADPSSFGFGAVLWQLKDDKLRPVAYTSRCFTETEKRYAQIEKESLAVTWACEKFRPFILGLHFRLETDHRPLVSLLGNKSIDQLSPRLQRFRMRLMWFDYDIAYVQRKNLTTADALSRSPTTKKDAQDQLSREAERLINMIIETAPISNVKLQHIRETVQNDNVCKTVLNYC